MHEPTPRASAEISHPEPSVSEANSERPRRGRPRDATRHDAILAAGFAEFAEKGFVAARLEDVAERAGVAKGTVYLYFANKEDLFQAAVRSRIVPLVEEVGDLARAHTGPAADLMVRAVTLAYQRLGTPDVQVLLRILITEGQRFPELLQFYYSEVVSKMVALAEMVVSRAVARGELSPGAMTGLPLVLFAPAMMGIVWQMTFAVARPVSMDEFRTAHLDLIARALTPPAK